MTEADDPKSILSRRLASGEINVSQYDEAIGRLNLNEYSKPSKQPVKRSLTGKLIGILSVFLYYVVGIALHSNGKSKPSEDESVAVFGHLTGALIGVSLILLLITYKISKTRPGVKAFILPIAAVFALIQFKIIESNNGYESSSKVRANPDLQKIVLAHTQRSTDRFELIFSKDQLKSAGESLPQNVTLDAIKLKCANLVSVRNASNEAEQTVRTKFPSIVREDDGKFVEDLKSAGVDQKEISTVVENADSAITTEKNLQNRMHAYRLLAARLDASANVCRFLEDRYGKWSIKTDGSAEFYEQKDLDDFNALAKVEAEAITALQTEVKK